MDPVTGAVVIVGLQKIGKPGADVVAKFLERVLAPTGDVLGQAMADPVREWQKRRLERASRLISEAADFLERTGQTPQPVPGRLLMPLLEKASLEDEPTLRDRWVRLLARAATVGATEVLPAYVQILGELTPVEVAILDRVFVEQYSAGTETGPIRLRHICAWAEELNVTERQLDIFADNYVRLGLWCQLDTWFDAGEIIRVVEERIRHARDANAYPVGPKGISLRRDRNTFEFTELGVNFLSLCQ